MKNGYSFAFATVVVDLYLDVLTVGLIFTFFRFTGLGSEGVIAVANVYAVLMLLLVILTILCFRYSKYLKTIIAKISSIFNSKIELGLLYISWSIISSLKAIAEKLNKKDLLFRTIGMWGAYFLSYACFSQFITMCGMKISFSEVFRILFSKNCATIFLENVLYGTYLQAPEFPFYLMTYMMIPLILIFACVKMKKPFHGKAHTLKEQEYKYLLPHLNENDRLSFLETYFSNKSDKEYLNLYLSINQNVNILRDYSAGSNASTILCVDNAKTFYRKYTFGEDAIKLREQVEWLENHRNTLPLPHILAKNIGENYCCYDMEFDVKAIGFFQFIHTVPSELSWKILQQVLKVLEEKLYHTNAKKMDDSKTREYIDRKVTANLEIIKDNKYTHSLYEYKNIFINGKEYPNLKQYKEKLSEENLMKIFGEDTFSDIHGDLTIENIICMQTEEIGFYLIDPNTENIHSSSYLDYSKLLQSLHGGYEFLMSAQNVEIEDNRIRFLDAESAAYKALYLRYKEYLHENYSKQEVKSIYYHEIVHFLRLLPYKFRKNGKRSVIFYAKLLMILDDVEKMF